MLIMLRIPFSLFADGAHPGGEWQFPEPPPSMTYENVDEYRRDAVMASGANQDFLGYREGPIYVS